MDSINQPAGAAASNAANPLQLKLQKQQQDSSSSQQKPAAAAAAAADNAQRTYFTSYLISSFLPFFRSLSLSLSREVRKYQILKTKTKGRVFSSTATTRLKKVKSYYLL